MTRQRRVHTSTGSRLRPRARRRSRPVSCVLSAWHSKVNAAALRSWPRRSCRKRDTARAPRGPTRRSRSSGSWRSRRTCGPCRERALDDLAAVLGTDRAGVFDDRLRRLALGIARARDEAPEAAGLDDHRAAAVRADLVGRLVCASRACGSFCSASSRSLLEGSVEGAQHVDPVHRSGPRLGRVRLPSWP